MVKSYVQEFSNSSVFGAGDTSFSDDPIVSELPPPGMCFVAQKPDLFYTNFPPGIRKGHPYLRTRTYPTKIRNDSCENCFPYFYHRIIGVDGCKYLTALKILILVTTVPREYSLRQAIRKTWGRNTNLTKTIFLFGIGWPMKQQKLLYDESKRYGDILQDNYIDSYYNLSLKVLSGYHWWSKHCRNAPFVLRTATDNFINIANLLKVIKTRTSWKRRIFGATVTHMTPRRRVKSKVYLTTNEYPHKYLRPFCHGSAFITPASTVDLILNASPNIPYFPLEDVYFGMVMAYSQNGSGVEKIKGFDSYYKKIISNETIKCKVPSNFINLHDVKSDRMMHWIMKYCLS